MRVGGEEVSQELVEEASKEVNSALRECDGIYRKGIEGGWEEGVGDLVLNTFQEYLDREKDQKLRAIKQELLDWHFRYNIYSFVYFTTSLLKVQNYSDIYYTFIYLK